MPTTTTAAITMPTISAVFEPQDAVSATLGPTLL